MQEYDIIIVGAGPIGASLAVALQNQGLKIAIIEKYLPSVKSQNPTEERPISLAYASREILQTLGIWKSLQREASKIEEVHVSELGVLGGVHFKAAEQGVDSLGFVVSYTKLHLALYESAAQDPQVAILPINEISFIKQLDDHVLLEIQTANGVQQLKSQLLVGCDGAHSFVRECLKVPTTKASQNKSALIATLRFHCEYPPIAYERFWKEEVLATLPLLDKNKCGFVWTLENEKLKKIQQWSQDEYIQFLEKKFMGRIPKIESISINATFPLQTIVAKKQYLPHVLLLGNAAHTLYPLAAQGFNLGLRDVAACAEVLVHAKKEMKNLGCEEVLKRYVDWRAGDQEKILQLTNRISFGFAISTPFASKLRGLGLLMTDVVFPLKNRLAKLTMGLNGKLPRLVRGLPL